MSSDREPEKPMNLKKHREMMDAAKAVIGSSRQIPSTTEEPAESES